MQGDRISGVAVDGGVPVDSPSDGGPLATDPLRWLCRGLFAPGLAETLAWQPFRLGVAIHPLHGQPGETAAAALLRYQPGASIPAHQHLGFEHILILEGSQEDEQGVYTAGTLLVHGPGTRHSIHSTEGCLVLAIWSDGLTPG